MKIQIFNYHGSIIETEIEDGYCLCHPNWIIRDSFKYYDFLEEKWFPIPHSYIGVYCSALGYVIRPISELH